jgi:hypothetical protein
MGSFFSKQATVDSVVYTYMREFCDLYVMTDDPKRYMSMVECCSAMYTFLHKIIKINDIISPISYRITIEEIYLSVRTYLTEHFPSIQIHGYRINGERGSLEGIFIKGAYLRMFPSVDMDDST